MTPMGKMGHPGKDLVGTMTTPSTTRFNGIEADSFRSIKSHASLRLQAMNNRYAVIDSRLVELILVADGDALTGLYFRHHWYRPNAGTSGPRIDAGADALLAKAHTQVIAYVAGERTDFDLSVTCGEKEMQRRIRRFLVTGPFGETVMAPRAVEITHC
jgi:hypothetical protein